MDDLHAPTMPAGLPANPSASFNPARAATVHALDLKAAPSDADFPAAGSVPARPAGGTFALRKPIASGGFGEVWEAEQTSLGRVIAVKRIREDLYDRAASAEQLERLFCQEAMTAAVLDHPNILPIHDLGLDDRGRPLIAMKLVRGRPWQDMIADEFRDPPAEFLDRHLPILASMAQAVAFAHSRGIVHRDLKPSQVMVGSFGEVLLMDWGLSVCIDGGEAARREGGASGMAWAATIDSASNPAGTAAFMAPEQTFPSASKIGTWTDVYLLGATLYYLLTGRLPHEGEDSLKVFYAASQGHVVPARRAAPRRWMPEELVVLAEEAMHVSPAKRLPSAAAFRERVQDYLSGASRKRESAACAARARQAMAKASRDYAAHEAVLAELARAQELWPQNPEAAELAPAARREYARAALAHEDLVLARLHAERMPEGEERAAVLADVAGREAAKRRRIRIRKVATASAFGLLGVVIAGGAVFQSRLRAERDAARAARMESEGLAAFMINDLRAELEPIGRIDVLDKASRRLLDHYKAVDPALLSKKELVAVHTGLVNVATLYLDSQGNLDFAREALEAARRIGGEQLRRTGDTDWAFHHAAALERLGRVAARSGNIGDGISKTSEAADLLEATVARFPEGALRERLELAQVYARLATLKVQSGDAAANFDCLERALRHVEEYLVRRPDDEDALFRLATIRHNYARGLIGMGKLESGVPALQQAVADIEALDQRRPDHPPYGTSYARALANLAGQLVRDKRLAEAEAVARRRLEVTERYLAANAANTRWLNENAMARRNLATVLLRTGRDTEGIAELQIAVPTMQDLVARDASNREWTADLAVLLNDLGNIEMRRKDWRAAEGAFAQVADVFCRLAESDPANALWERNYAESLVFLADARTEQGNTDGALAALAQSEAMLRAMISPGRKEDAAEQALQSVLRATAHALKRAGRAEEAAAREAELEALNRRLGKRE